MPEFTKATRRPGKPSEEPEGLDQFAAGAPNVRLVGAPAPESASSLPDELRASAVPPVESPMPAGERLAYGMNVRFTASEKMILEKLAAKEDRSQHQILKRLLRPVLLEAAKGLDDA